jgi:hypothetical protein
LVVCRQGVLVVCRWLGGCKARGLAVHLIRQPLQVQHGQALPLDRVRGGHSDAGSRSIMAGWHRGRVILGC